MCQEWQPNRSKNKDWWAEFKPKLIESLQNCSHYLPLCCIPKIRIKVESSCGRPSVWMASAFCIQLGACGCSCRAPSRPSRLHLRVLVFFVIVFFLTINLSEAYQSSSPTCLFCHLTTPAEMMLSNTHTHRDVPHTTNSRTQAKEALIFFCSTIKTQNLSKPVCAWCDSLTAVVYQLHITFLGAKLAKNSYQKWKEGPFPYLLSSPPPPLPSSSQCVTSEKSREHSPTPLEDFLILWQNDKLWLTSSMWVRETWGRTACIAFCNYISFTALFLLPTLCSSSK